MMNSKKVYLCFCGLLLASLEVRSDEPGSDSYSVPVSSSYRAVSSPSSFSSSGSSYSAPAQGSSSYSAGSSSYSSPVGSSGSYSAPVSSSSSYSSPVSSSSSYSSPASSGSSYSAPSSDSYSAGTPVSTGNIYYYYYPVAAHPVTYAPKAPSGKKSDISPLLFLLIPLVILLAAVPLLGLLTPTTQRSFTPRNSELDDKFGSFGELQMEVDKLLQKYIVALDSEQCMDRVVCELGTRAQNIPSKKLFFGVVEYLAPKNLLLGKERLAVFKKAAMSSDYTLDTCKMFTCNPPKEVTHTSSSSETSSIA